MVWNKKKHKPINNTIYSGGVSSGTGANPVAACRRADIQRIHIHTYSQ